MSETAFLSIMGS